MYDEMRLRLERVERSKEARRVKDKEFTEKLQKRPVGPREDQACFTVTEAYKMLY